MVARTMAGRYGDRRVSTRWGFMIYGVRTHCGSISLVLRVRTPCIACEGSCNFGLPSLQFSRPPLTSSLPALWLLSIQ